MSVFDMSALLVERPPAKKRRLARAEPPTASLPVVREEQEPSINTELLTLEEQEPTSTELHAVPEPPESARTAPPTVATAQTTVQQEPFVAHEEQAQIVAHEASVVDMHRARLERLQDWFSGVKLTLGELALHQDALETYVVGCLQDKAFSSDDRALCEQAAAHLLEPEAAATGALGELELAFQDLLNATLLRHDRLFVDYCAQFDSPFAEYAAALVVSPHTLQHLKWLAFNARLRHAIPDTLAIAVRSNRQTQR
jgi:hypothetical protein